MKKFKEFIVEAKAVIDPAEVEKHVNKFQDISGSGQGEFPDDYHYQEWRKHAASIPAEHKAAVHRAIKKDMHDSGEYTGNNIRDISRIYHPKG